MVSGKPVLTGNTDCPVPSDYRCLGVSPTEGVCVKVCDTLKGTLTNKDCPIGSECSNMLNGAMPGITDLCLPFGPPANGKINKAGERCTGDRLDTDCNGASGLYCDNVDVSSSFKCVKACDPRTLKENNPACDSGQLCLPDSNSFYQGGCGSAPSKDVGAWCNVLTNGCKEGLTSAAGQCYKTCDKKLGEENNPACPEPKADYACADWKDSWGNSYGTFCRKKCDTKQGALPNPTCPTGAGCVSLLVEEKGPGFCVPTSYPSNDGTIDKGAPCSGYGFGACKNGLVCVYGTCEQSCDPKATETGCGKDQFCMPSWSSSLGGYCL
jgi:hypothetical protein